LGAARDGLRRRQHDRATNAYLGKGNLCGCIRNVYLQVLALMHADRLPAGLGFAAEVVVAFWEFCDNHGLTRQQFALHYARNRFPSSVLVVGAETAEQAAANCRLMSAASSHDDLHRAWDGRWPDDVEDLVDPSKWPSMTRR